MVYILEKGQAVGYSPKGRHTTIQHQEPTANPRDHEATYSLLGRAKCVLSSQDGNTDKTE